MPIFWGAMLVLWSFMFFFNGQAETLNKKSTGETVKFFYAPCDIFLKN